MKSKFSLTVLCVLLSTVMVIAQVNQCSELIRAALQSAEEQCVGAGRNQICYGNSAMVVEAQPDAPNFTFENVGDIAEVAAIQRLQLEGLDPERGVWGVVLMRVQANIPNTLPGQNVTVMLFGDTEIRNAATSVEQQVGDEPKFAPMQAFYFTTGIGGTSCNEVPGDGMLIQTPQGVGSIDLVVNEVRVNMGSTVYFTVNDNRELGVYSLEGGARLTANGRTQTSVAGTRVRIPLDDDNTADGEPLAVESYEDYEIIELLPVDALEREIEIAPPLEDEELELFREYNDLFDNIDIEDVEELFDYIDDNWQDADFDIADYLIDDLGYDSFDDDLADYLQDELGYDLNDDEDFDDESLDDISEESSDDDFGGDDSGGDDSGSDEDFGGDDGDGGE